MNVVEKVFKAGVVGEGGAGFPTHIKLKTSVEYFIINGAECEPFLATDQYIMKHHARDMIRAMDICAEHLGAKHAVIALKGKYKGEVKAIEEAIRLENSSVEVFLLDNYYPVGDEQMIVYEVTGRTVTPGSIPASVGAVVANVGTMVSIYDAIQDKPVTYKYVSIVGDVKTPMVARVPIGTSVSDCIALAGGSNLADYDIILGGPMMGTFIEKEAAQETVVTKVSGGIIVIPKNHYLVNMAQTSLEHIKNQTKSACIQCRYCTDLCPRFLIGHPLEPHKIMRQFGQVTEYGEEFKSALLCCDCGICELYACPMQLAPRLVNGFIKGELRKQGIGYTGDDTKVEAREMADYRKISQERLIPRIDLADYKAAKPAIYQEFEPDQVEIPLSQHIGKPARPIVSEGDTVAVGDLIASVSEDEVGANIHASISGIVLKVSNRITIQKDSQGVNEA